ncbi:S-adenosylmethionine synthetase [Euryarchaeota archaeon SM23-78]|nr:MAG: S-adenosylmethionine synthetase [Euryarchaeota archaeon SM23-78]MBW3000646.1 methionine adenosyltransferase [Candidatus Woesearchaeota archaeon]
MDGNYFFTSESVTEGHPDKVADQVSDAILDAMLKDDPNSRVAVECLTKTGFIIAAGEVTTKTYVDIQEVVRNTLKEIGYDKPEYGFDYKTCGVLTSISEQSPDIAQGVNETKEHEQGAGDQGIMFGYACKETPELMPLPIMLAHKLTMRLAEARKKKELTFLRPDGKSQVTVEYDDGKPVRVGAVVVSTHHDPDISIEELRKQVKEKIIKPVCGEWIDDKTKFFINPTGRFVIGGPVADSGLTGRKIIVDTYGGVGSHGGGCFSGKDPSKVDRSASYMARYIAKNIVAAGLADKCEVQLGYAIGIAEPVSVLVDTFGTGKIDNGKLLELIKKNFPLKPAEMIKYLKLKRPIYKKTACYGHFGRQEPEFTWEKTDKAEVLKKEAFS